MKINFFSALILAAAMSPARAAAPSQGPAAPDAVKVRAVAWDFEWKPATETEWRDRLVKEVASAVKDGADIIVFPEGFAKDRRLDAVLERLKDAAQERLVVLGNSPRKEADGSVVSRAFILAGGAWQSMDKLDPTPAERAQKPPVTPGYRIVLFRYRGGLVAALPAYSIAKPEFGVALKKRGVSLVLVSAPPEDEEGAARVARCASARAVELGAAVVVAPPASAAPALYLPAQKGFDLQPKAAAGRDFTIPWKKLLDLRVAPGTEARPFLDTAPAYQTEI